MLLVSTSVSLFFSFLLLWGDLKLEQDDFSHLHTSESLTSVGLTFIHRRLVLAALSRGPRGFLGNSRVQPSIIRHVE